MTADVVEIEGARAAKSGEVDSRNQALDRIVPFPSPGYSPLYHGDRAYTLVMRTERDPQWHGLYLKQLSKGGKIQVEHVCESPFLVKSLVIDVDGGDQAIEISFIPSGMKNWLTQVWDRASLVNGKIDSPCWKRLTRSGLNISASQLPRLQAYIRLASDYLVQTNKIEVKKGTSRTGWQKTEYVAPGWRTTAAPLYIGPLDSRAGAWERKGDRENYLRFFKHLLMENPCVELICGYQLSGYLLSRFGGTENFILAILGDSSLGKTLSAKVGLSMKGHPEAYVDFDATGGALKAMMQQHNDSCLVIDETGKSAMSDEQKARFIYDVASGRDRMRLQHSGDKYETAAPSTAKYSVLITGEVTFLKNPSAAGQMVRFTEVVFDRDEQPLWNSITSWKEAVDIESFIGDNYGWVAPLVIEKIREQGDKYHAVYRDSLQRFADDTTDAKAQRKHKLLAAIMAGTAVLNDALDKHWDQERTFAILRKISDQTVREMGDHGSDEQQYLDALRGTPMRFRSMIYYSENPDQIEEPRRDPALGSYNATAKVHIFVLVSNMANHWADQSGVDLQRFLNWAESKGYLVMYKDGKERDKPRRTYRHIVGKTAVYSYKFTFKGTEDDGGEVENPGMAPLQEAPF